MSYLTRAPVSVVIPCYNSHSTLRRAINSIVAQTLKPAEIILIDDFSNDNGRTHNEIRRIKYELNRLLPIVVIFNSCNSGPGFTRNQGWEVAKQPYLAFLDSDDVWHPQKLEIQIKFIMDNPSAILVGAKTDLYSNEFKIIKAQHDVQRVTPHGMVFGNPFCTSGIIINRNVRHRFESNAYFAEDYMLWSDVCCDYPQSCYVINSVLSYSFKSILSKKGLSGSYLKMELAEINVIKKLCNRNCSHIVIKFGSYAWSIAKFLRRLILSKLSKFDY